jgi:hypothetical protein
MKKLLLVLTCASILYACGGSSQTNNPSQSSNPTTQSQPESTNPDYDPNRGEGTYTADNVSIGVNLNKEMAKAGEEVQGVKCSSCHRLTDEKLVGPGWKGVTERRKPEWIMNFITNPDPMIDKDPAVQAQLELCLVRMPNQSLSDTEARNILEFMRKNDGVQ